MGRQQTPDSLWRIEFAKEVIGPYVEQPGVKMIVLSGSPPKGLSDQYSDLDLIVFWNTIDGDWLEAEPLSGIDCDRRYFRKTGEADLYLEGYYFGNLKVDFGHTTLADWKDTIDGVLERHEFESDAFDAIAGFRTSLPLQGEELALEFKKRLEEYPDELRSKVVGQHMRMFVPGYLLNQALKRGDVLAYYDGLCLMFKNILNILAGLNRVYMSTGEPRWIEHYLGQMPIRPENAWARIRTALEGDGETAVGILEELTEEVLGLVETHMPEVAERVARIRAMRPRMAVEGTPERPEIRGRTEP